MMRDASSAFPPHPQETLSDLLTHAQRCLLQNDPVRALRYAQQAEHLARRSDDQARWARAQLLWGIGCLRLERPDVAILVLTGALGTYRLLDDREGEWQALRLIARGWEAMEDLEQAGQTRQAADALGRFSGEGWLEDLDAPVAFWDAARDR